MNAYFYTVLILCNIFSVRAISNVTIEDALANLTTTNDLWLGIVRDCKKPTASCLQNSIYNYLKDTLDYPSDVQFTNFMKFTKNNINYEDVQKSFPVHNNETIEDDSTRLETPLEEMSRSLTDNTRKFFFTHDLELKLPEVLFMGSILKVSPRSFQDSGAILKVEIIPRTANTSVGEGRIFFEKIKSFIADRLLFALLAILLVIKLLAVKVLFILPSILGVVAAKKLILKVLLFIFPALHHLFNLCKYVPHGAKHHIHKHQISHIHEVAHGHYPHAPPHHGHGPVEVAAPYGGGPHYAEFGHKDYQADGEEDPESYYANELLAHRNDQDQESNEVDVWGQGQSARKPKPTGGRPPTPVELENMILKAEKEALIKSRLQKEKERIHMENLRLQDQLNKALKLQEQLKKHAVGYGAKIPHIVSPIKAGPILVPPPPPPPPRQQQSRPHKIETSFAEPPDDYVENSLKANGGFSTVYTPQQNIRPMYPVYGPPESQGFQPSVISPPSPQAPANNFETSAAVTQVYRTPVAKPQVYQQTPGYQTQAFVTPAPEINFNKYTQPRNPDGKTLFENTRPLEIQSLFETVKVKPDEKKQNFPASKTERKDTFTEKEVTYTEQSSYDAFYSPILEKIDKILNSLQFIEEPCRERLICSMYKNPEKFSPHSNLLSVELSRDSKELQKPNRTNAAVIRFYKYVQAARDGQDKRDCLQLYPACAVNTEI